ncbi:DUF3634 family protein [Rubritalea profundi]|uniref:DUF3634 family protein n=1 Tax=Rubritalea profundi TaxID=1658618 RepID=UPI002689D0AB
MSKFLSLLWASQPIYRLGERISTRGTPLVHLRIKGGNCVWKSGTLSSATTRTITGLLREANISNAVVKRYRDKGFHFSPSIPEAMRQKLRNVLSLS